MTGLGAPQHAQVVLSMLWGWAYWRTRAHLSLRPLGGFSEAPGLLGVSACLLYTSPSPRD
eukprot:11072538-Alexandrium_andersonii.AAC.1